MIRYSPANAKLKKLAKSQFAQQYLGRIGRRRRKVYSFDLMSGFSCPLAKECMSRAIPAMVDGKNTVRVKDGPDTLFRCFSASEEAFYPSVYKFRKANWDAIRAMGSTAEIVDAHLNAMPDDAGIVRIHVAGDMFNQQYFDAWLEVAKARQNVLFYAYTKSIPFWLARRADVPDNLSLTASRGGRRDDLICEHGLKEAVVVYSVEEAERLGLEIDHDDSHAADGSKGSFALLIHGTQPKGSEASKALYRLRKSGVDFEYSR
jgi:hypothetical protein